MVNHRDPEVGRTADPDPENRIHRHTGEPGRRGIAFWRKAHQVATVPQKHTLHSNTLNADIGTLKHLPPTLLAQYHFDANGFKPYVGAGINYTHFSSVNVPGADVDRNSWGPALQVGVDIPLSGNMYLNFDLKKVYIRTDVSVAGVNQGTFKIDPVLAGVGLGWRF